MSKKSKRIKVELSNNKFISETKKKSEHVRLKDDVHWTIEEKDPMPEDATVELRFADGSIVGNPVLSDDGLRKIIGLIHNVNLGSYTYKVWYVRGNEQYMMEDPELVMDGNLIKKKVAKKATRKAKKR